MTIAFFLGAGASKADGAPLQNELFYEYFKLMKSQETNLVHASLKAFFQEFFNIATDQSDLKTMSFPTFEEALGILDLAEIRNETFRRSITDTYSPKDTKILRAHLIHILAKIIKEKLSGENIFHEMLIKNLRDASMLDNIVFLTTNYDILIDNSLLRCGGNFRLDYGIDFQNDDTFSSPSRGGTKLYKLHGSLNWLHCTTCNDMKYNLFNKFDVDQDVSCSFCNTSYNPFIIPPTYFKNLSNPFVSQVWNKAENTLSSVTTIIFCGYSFPDADMHIKYLLKRIETNRKPTLAPLKIKVFNNYSKKTEREKKPERDRFQRFFRGNVEYLDVSFEELSQNPTSYF